jgi:hypothetical protein
MSDMAWVMAGDDQYGQAESGSLKPGRARHATMRHDMMIKKEL